MSQSLDDAPEMTALLCIYCITTQRPTLKNVKFGKSSTQKLGHGRIKAAYATLFQLPGAYAL